MGKSSKSAKRAAEDVVPSSDAIAPAEAVAMDVDAAPKSKKSKKDKDDGEKEIPLDALAVIASPLAVKKTGKHVLKLVKKGESEHYRATASLNEPLLV